ncbi:MAG: O-antigen ligase family protein [Acidobacteriaceae bacterium]|nr:O-antigen ligase family protein [Acidobacteriaceae bacterium]MBV9781093.1 O-antigen ligase family protein [Acidobacteriaceae bacterium]
MFASEETRNQILLVTAISAAALIHVSIAASQVLLGVGILLLLVFRQRLEFPRIWIPLALFFLWTALADVLSPDPWGGRAQIKKFFVFLFIPLIYAIFSRQFQKVFYLVIAWAAAATASGIWGLVQFASKYQAYKVAPEGFYVAYIRRRITGFESHWMTFGALQLSVFSLLLAQVFFSNRRMPAWAYSSLAVLSATILIGWTRSIWLAAIPSTLYLIWFWRPKMTLAVPVLAALLFFIAPPATRNRMMSLFQPREDVDSNRHRIVTFRTGLEMIKAHPWFGLGPEQIRRNFDAYVPSDIQRPLPVGYYGHLHNDYVQYAAERGIPALLLILWLIGMTVYDCFRGILNAGRATCQELFILHGTIAVIIGILVGGLFEYNLGDSEVLMMFLSVVGLGYAALSSLAMMEKHGNYNAQSG